jgi:hypothetical protein
VRYCVLGARLQSVWAYDTDLLSTRPIAWAGANGLAGAFGRHRVRGCARSRHRVLAHHADRSTFVSASACAELCLSLLPGRGFLIQLSPAMANRRLVGIGRRKRTLPTWRDRGALR